MNKVLYHKFLAWNLIEDAVESGMITPPRPGSYWSAKRAEGYTEGWIGPAVRQHAREMFVYVEQALLPGEVDVPPIEALWEPGAVTWAVSAVPSMRTDLLAVHWSLPILLNLKPFVVEALHTRGYEIDDETFRRLVERWEEEKRTDEAFMRTMRSASLSHEDAKLILDRLSGARPRASDEERIAALQELVSDEFSFLQDVFYLAERGIPSLGKIPQLPQHNPATLANVASNTEAIVAYYFNNVVRCPSPATLKDALAYRRNEGVLRWREKMDEFSMRLASGELSQADIENEINEANKYIEGAKVFSRIKPRWTLAITVPLGVATQLIPGLAPIGWLLLGAEAVELYGMLAEKAVVSPDRLHYKWLMLSG